MPARIPRCRRWASPRLLLISFNKPAKKTFPGPSSIKNFHARSASRSMVHILSRRYPLGVKNSLSVCGTRSDWHSNNPQVNGIMCLSAPMGALINLHDCESSSGHTGGYSALSCTSPNILCCALMHRPQTVARGPPHSRREKNQRSSATKASASDKSHLQRSAPPAGIFPPKVWRELESPSLGTVL